jgi:sortase (surface protein transpeptidase)
VAAIMNEFSKRSRASISKQTKQQILKVFSKIKESTQGDNGNVMKKYKIVKEVITSLKIVEANDVTHNLTF